MIRVHTTGCSLIDNLYGRVDFTRPDYNRLLSREAGDGGLTTGGLVFSEALTEFAGTEYRTILKSLTGVDAPDASNIGGPGIVAVLHAAQVNDNPDIRFRFAGVLGKDGNGRRFTELMGRTGFPMADYATNNLPTPSTDVLSDPDHGKGSGERTFINTIGAAGAYGPESLPDDFFDAELLAFGGTALVPPIHDALDSLCRRGQESGAFVLVNTVYDFRSEAKMKGRPWPLVEDYRNIDLLIVDQEESLKISGRGDAHQAMRWFLDRGCRAVIITRGIEDVLFAAGNDSRFASPERTSLPTSRYADEVVAACTHPRDTTGCGDNFVGGVLASIADQLAAGADAPLNLVDAVKSGVASGSLALTCLGGVFYEEKPGDKRRALEPFITEYERELAG